MRVLRGTAARPGPSSLYQMASVSITILLYNGPFLCCFTVPIKRNVSHFFYTDDMVCHVVKSRGTSPATEQALEDASELVVKDGVDGRIEEAVDVAEPREQREDERVDSTDGADVEQVVADADGVADVDSEERNPAEQKHA